uniref:Uncharacterized protein n=1 Tax=Pithovirus LCDPAC01 TaxID=2506600 RepID=A0A481YN72_9VIRU|nr:MAG: hypothetical protein LCDPAC01_00470 [Pithovirus LCDPAC01]
MSSNIRKSGSAKHHVVLNNCLPFSLRIPKDTGYFEETVYSDTTMNSVKRVFHSLGIDLKRGDTVSIGSPLSVKMIHDGKLIIPLDYSVDEYGGIPSSFQVISEFPVHYWKSANKHSNLVWFDVGKLKYPRDGVKIFKGAPYLEFAGYDNQLYYIRTSKDTLDSKTTFDPKGFYDDVFSNKDVTPFGYVSVKERWPMPSGTNYDNVLVYPYISVDMF